MMSENLADETVGCTVLFWVCWLREGPGSKMQIQMYVFLHQHMDKWRKTTTRITLIYKTEPSHSLINLTKRMRLQKWVFIHIQTVLVMSLHRCMAPVSMSYLRTPSMAGVQGGRVVLLHTLIHTQVAHFRVTNLKSQSVFYNPTRLHLPQFSLSLYIFVYRCSSSHIKHFLQPCFRCFVALSRLVWNMLQSAEVTQSPNLSGIRVVLFFIPQLRQCVGMCSLLFFL